jgi:glycosyltransferase involved in cell wall biosynthesis
VTEGRPAGVVGYLVPEFPGQTHVWIWRELVHMREWGVTVRLFSTRPPDKVSAARHAFAQQARSETTYVWPRPIRSILGALVWAVATRPRGLARAATIPLGLDGTSLRQRLASLPLIAAACVFSREAATHQISHVHVHSAGRSAVIAMMAHRLVAVPYSIALSAHLDWWGGGMRAKLTNADFVLVNARWLRDAIFETFPEIPRSKVAIAHPGVDIERWTPGTTSRDDSSFRLVTVARVHHGKGHDLVIQAVARLRASRRDVQLTIAGGGPATEWLKSIIGELGLGEAVRFSGSLSEDDVMTLLRASDAFVLASRFEALGVVFMEAMAVGLPVVGTDVGGVSEVITHEYDGVLVPPEDPDAIADAITRLMDDEALRTRFARNARASVVDRFDSRVGARVFYERLFGEPPPAQP